MYIVNFGSQLTEMHEESLYIIWKDCCEAFVSFVDGKTLVLLGQACAYGRQLLQQTTDV
jgi:hypothetical protein